MNRKSFDLRPVLFLICTLFEHILSKVSLLPCWFASTLLQCKLNTSSFSYSSNYSGSRGIIPSLSVEGFYCEISLRNCLTSRINLDNQNYINIVVLMLVKLCKYKICRLYHASHYSTGTNSFDWFLSDCWDLVHWSHAYWAFSLCVMIVLFAHFCVGYKSQVKSLCVGSSFITINHLIMLHTARSMSLITTSSAMCTHTHMQTHTFRFVWVCLLWAQKAGAQ